MVGSYYRKTKPETQQKNREEYKKLYSTERKWLGDNLELLKDASFSHLHNHSQFSILQSTITVKGLVKQAVENKS